MIIFNFATRNRPEQFKKAVESIVRNITSIRYKILVKCDIDDNCLLQYSDICNYYDCYLLLGDSKSKIEAINFSLDRNVHEYDFVVNMSDDMRFITKCFDLQLIQDFGDNFDQFIHYPDGHTGDKLCTMSIMGGAYLRRFGYIYHPDYKSLWCDNEAQEVAKQLGKYKYIDKQLFEHRHPAWTGGPKDTLLMKTESYYQHDKETYEKRKAAGFPLKSIFE